MPKEPRKAPLKLIPRTEAEGIQSPIYTLMDELIASYHPELVDLTISIFWKYHIKEDAQGKLLLGKAQKASEFEREYSEVDANILLNWDFWNHPSTTDNQRKALLDHELCHLSVKVDENDDVEMDERNRPIVALMKHDVEEFKVVIERWGTWTSEIHDMYQAIKIHEASEEGAS